MTNGERCGTRGLGERSGMEGDTCDGVTWTVATARLSSCSFRSSLASFCLSLCCIVCSLQYMTGTYRPLSSLSTRRISKLLSCAQVGWNARVQSGHAQAQQQPTSSLHTTHSRPHSDAGMECTFVSLSMASESCQLMQGIHTAQRMCTQGWQASSVGEKQPERWPHMKQAVELGAAPEAQRRHCQDDCAAAVSAASVTPQQGACTYTEQRLQCSRGSSLLARHTAQEGRLEERDSENEEEDEAEAATA